MLQSRNGIVTIELIYDNISELPVDRMPIFLHSFYTLQLKVINSDELKVELTLTLVNF